MTCVALRYDVAFNWGINSFFHMSLDFIEAACGHWPCNRQLVLLQPAVNCAIIAG
jgi:hypothetical protein